MASKSDLILIADFEPGSAVNHIVEYINQFPKVDVECLWLDPNISPRAVAQLAEKIDVLELQTKCRQNPFAGHSVHIVKVSPAQSIFVRTYMQNNIGIKDKLGYLFTIKKYGGEKVKHVSKLVNDDCFEIHFQEGWDAVQNICEYKWKLENMPLLVTPYFECFKDPYESQRGNKSSPHLCQNSQSIKNTRPSEGRRNAQEHVNRHRTGEAQFFHDDSYLSSSKAEFSTQYEETPKWRNISPEQGTGYTKQEAPQKYHILQRPESTEKDMSQMCGHSYQNETVSKQEEMTQDIRILHKHRSEYNDEDAPQRNEGMSRLKQKSGYPGEDVPQRNLALDQLRPKYPGENTYKTSQLFQLHQSSKYPEEEEEEALHQRQEFKEQERPALPSSKSTGIFRETIYCENCLLLILLKALDFKEALRAVEPQIKVEIDDERRKIVFIGPKTQIRPLKSQLIRYNSQMTLPAHHEQFLMGDERQACIKEFLQNDEIKFSFNKDGEFELEQKRERLSFVAFCNQFIEETALTINLALIESNAEQWNTFIRCLNDRNPYWKLVQTEKGWCHLNFSGDSSKKEHISHMYEQIVSFLYSTDENENEEIELFSKHIFHPTEKIEFFMQFFEKALEAIKNKYINYDPKIDVSKGVLSVTCKSRTQLENIITDIDSFINKIKIDETKALPYPGIQKFLESRKGSQLLDTISKKHTCKITLNDQGIQSTVENVATGKDFVDYNYSAALLGTSEKKGFRFHLVQADVQEVHTQLQVNFIPEKSGESSTFSRSNGKGGKYFIELPVCFISLSSSLQKWREKLVDRNTIICAQCDALDSTSLSLSAKEILKEHNRFPLGDFARLTVEVFEKHFAEKEMSAGLQQVVDVYLCESTDVALLEAFIYYLKDFKPTRYEGSSCWDKISREYTPQEHVDYNQHTKVKLVERPIYFSTFSTLLCCPVYPDMEFYDCPLSSEPFCQNEYDKESLIKAFKHMKKEVLAPGQSYVLQTEWRQKVLLYESQMWKPGFQETLSAGLSACINDAKKNSYSGVCIMLPGLAMNSPRCPMKYLAQEVFRILDRMMRMKVEFPTETVLVIPEKKALEAFRFQLQKRIKEKKSWTSNLKSFWAENFTGKTTASDNTGQSEEICKVSPEPQKIVICSTNASSLQKAFSDLNDELEKQMQRSRIHLGNNSEKVKWIKDCVTQGLPDVAMELKIKYIEKDKKSKKRKSQIDCAVVIITGLSSEVVSDRKAELEKVLFSSKTESSFQNNNITSEQRQGEPMDLSDSEWQKVEFHENRKALSLPVDVETKDVLLKRTSVKSAYWDSEENLKDFFFKITGISAATDGENEKFPVLEQGKFFWKYQVTDKGKTTFKAFSLPKSRHLEEAFVKGAKEYMWKTGDYLSLNFKTMKLQLRSGDDVKDATVLRQEEFPDSRKNISLPSFWSHMKESDFKCEKLQENEQEYNILKKSIENCFPSHHVDFTRMERIQNVNLFKRFMTKRPKLERELCEQMWYRVDNDNRRVICNYGFHPVFQRPAKNGDCENPVFYQKIEDLISETDIADNKDIYLLSCLVHVEASSQSTEGLDSLSYGKTETSCSSMKNKDGSIVIFSDAMAYPFYLVLFRIGSE